MCYDVLQIFKKGTLKKSMVHKKEVLEEFLLSLGKTIVSFILTDLCGNVPLVILLDFLRTQI